MSTDTPSNKTPEEEAQPRKGPFQSTRQRRIYDRLKKIGSTTEHCDDTPLASLYYGALYTLADTHNPDRLSQSASGLVELLGMMPECLPNSPIQRSELESDYLKKRLNLIMRAYSPLNPRSTSPVTEFVDKLDYLKNFLKVVDNEIQLFAEPDRYTNTHRASDFVRESTNFSGAVLPGQQEKQIEELIDEMTTLRHDAEKVKHHDHIPTTPEYNALVNRYDDFLVKIIFPIHATPIQNLDMLDSIISQGESND